MVTREDRQLAAFHSWIEGVLDGCDLCRDFFNSPKRSQGLGFHVNLALKIGGECRLVFHGVSLSRALTDYELA